MVLSEIYTSILKCSNSLGIHINFTNEDSVINLIHIKRKGSSLLIDSRSTISDIDLIDKTYKNSPSVLVITGSKLVFKIIDHASEDKMLSGIIPVGTKNDFYYKEYPIDEKKSWIAIVRKSIITELLSKLKSRKIFVSNIELGPFSISNIIPLLGKESDSLYVGDNALIIEKGKIIQIVSSTESKDYKIEEETISSDELLSYCSALSYYSSSNRIKDYEYGSVFEEYGYYRKSKLFVISLASVMMLVLLINLFAFTSYRSEYNYLDERASLSKSDLVRLDSLKSKVSSYQSLIKKNSLDVKTIHSYICDRLIVKMPRGILLNHLSIGTPNKKIRKDELIKYADGNLMIKGECTSPLLLEKWLNNIKEEEWLSLVVGHEYYSKLGKGEFSIELQLK
jgi:hypothetical protein